MRGINMFTTHLLWLNQWSLKTGPRPARTRKFLSRAELGVSRHCATVLRCHWSTGNYLTISCWHIERLFKTFPLSSFMGMSTVMVSDWFLGEEFICVALQSLRNLEFLEESLTRRHNVQAVLGSDGSSSDTLGLVHTNWSKVLSLLLKI